MAAIPTVAVGGTARAQEINLIVGRVNGQALSGVIPTSAVGGSVGVTGKVTFSAVAAVSVNGVFTTDYDNYRIVWDIPTRTAVGYPALRLRAAGTDVTSATYAWVRGVDQGTARTVLTGTASTNIPLDTTPSVASVDADGVIDVFGPALTGGTSTSSLVAWYDTTNGSTQMQVTGRATSTAAADGFTVFVGSGTISGTVRVYGYNNLN